MADYFAYFSLVLPLPNEEAQKHALDLAHQAGSIQQGDKASGDFPSDLAKVAEDWRFETDLQNDAGQYGLWLHSENGGIDAVCAFIQHLLIKFEPEKRIGFEWSCDCSKPRLDAYGGGAAIITATEIKTMNTSAWLQAQQV